MSIHEELQKKAEKASGISKDKKFGYVAVGGMTSTLHGAEIKKNYAMLRDFNEIFSNLKDADQYITGGVQLHNRYITEILAIDYDKAVDALASLLNKLEFNLRDMQQAKGMQENRYLEKEQRLYLAGSDVNERGK